MKPCTLHLIRLMSDFAIKHVSEHQRHVSVSLYNSGIYNTNVDAAVEDIRELLLTLKQCDLVPLSDSVNDSQCVCYIVIMAYGTAQSLKFPYLVESVFS